MSEKQLPGMRANTGKPRVDLVAPSAMISIARVAEYGVRKYALRNWELGMEYSRIYSSMQRHLLAWWQGEDIDGGPEGSGLPHLDHIIWNAQALVEVDRLVAVGIVPVTADDRPSAWRARAQAAAQVTPVATPDQDMTVRQAINYIKGQPRDMLCEPSCPPGCNRCLAPKPPTPVSVCCYGCSILCKEGCENTGKPKSHIA